MTTMEEFARAIAKTMRRGVTSKAPERPGLHSLVGALLDPRTPAENPVRRWCDDPLRFPNGVISFRDEGGLVAELLLITHPKRCVRRPRRRSAMAPYGSFGAARLVSFTVQEAVELLVARGLLSEKWTDEQSSGRFFPVYGDDDPWSQEFRLTSDPWPQDLPTLLSIGSIGECTMRRAEEIVTQTVQWLRERSPKARDLNGPLRYFWAHRGRRILASDGWPVCWGSFGMDWLTPAGQFYGSSSRRMQVTAAPSAELSFGMDWLTPTGQFYGSSSGQMQVTVAPSAELWEMGLSLDRIDSVGDCVVAHLHARTWGGGMFWPRYETDSEFVAPRRRMP